MLTIYDSDNYHKWQTDWSPHYFSQLFSFTAWF